MSEVTFEDCAIRENAAQLPTSFLDGAEARFLRTDFVDNVPADVWADDESYTLGEDATGRCVPDLGCATW